MHRIMKLTSLFVLSIILFGFIYIYWQKPTYVSLKSAPSLNQLEINDIGLIELDETNNSEHKWFFEIKDAGIIKLTGGYVINYKSQLENTRTKHTWEYTPIKSGSTVVIYKYCKIADPSIVDKIVEYKITVK